MKIASSISVGCNLQASHLSATQYREKVTGLVESERFRFQFWFCYILTM